MERSLLPTTAQTGRRMHILHGLGGIGKTQLAIAHARKHQNTYSAVIWVNGNSRDTVLQSLSAFGRRASVDGVSESTAYTAQQAPDMEAEAAALLRWLSLEGNHRWLMVFDNVDRDVRPGEEDPQAFEVTSFLPPADHGSILITSRLASLGEMGQATEVGRLELDQALELLRHRSGLPASGNGRNSLPSKPRSISLTMHIQISRSSSSDSATSPSRWCKPAPTCARPRQGARSTSNYMRRHGPGSRRRHLGSETTRTGAFRRRG